jgi:hypothetical protein
MKSVMGGDKAVDEPAEVASAFEEPVGIRPARDGLQPIKDLASFLQTLPNFGQDAVRLREAIAEDRTLRRTAAAADEC